MKNFSISFKSVRGLVEHLESLVILSSSIDNSGLPHRDFSIDRRFIENSLRSMRKFRKHATKHFSFCLYIAFREHGFESSLDLSGFTLRLTAFSDVICKYVICYDYENLVYTLTQYNEEEK